MRGGKKEESERQIVGSKQIDDKRYYVSNFLISVACAERARIRGTTEQGVTLRQKGNKKKNLV